MVRRRAIYLCLGWLLGSVLLTTFLFGYGRRFLVTTLEEQLAVQLPQVLAESYFGAGPNRVDDSNAIRHVGERLNQALQGAVASRWYAPLQACSAQVQRIEDVVIGQSTSHTFLVRLQRSGVAREAAFDLFCKTHWLSPAAGSGFLALLFLAIYRLVPPPLSSIHRSWIRYLRERGYSGEGAFDLISGYDGDCLSLNPVQRQCLERLHEPEQQNFATALAIASDRRVADLAPERLEWLVLGLGRGGEASLPAALALAQAGDTVNIDLARMELSIHGLRIPVSKTPLFYYAWYAQQRLTSDGWVSNPASNRPDRDAGRALATLMLEYGGHAKAINDLEEHGLKARTLDQNRSKIREEIQAVLGDELARPYLFESDRRGEVGRARYRLSCMPQKIQITG